LVCRDCGRTDSPEWRKGPEGPKTLCNACGESAIVLVVLHCRNSSVYSIRRSPLCEAQISTRQTSERSNPDEEESSINTAPHRNTSIPPSFSQPYIDTTLPRSIFHFFAQPFGNSLSFSCPYFPISTYIVSIDCFTCCLDSLVSSLMSTFRNFGCTSCLHSSLPLSPLSLHSFLFLSACSLPCLPCLPPPKSTCSSHHDFLNIHAKRIAMMKKVLDSSRLLYKPPGCVSPTRISNSVRRVDKFVSLHDIQKSDERESLDNHWKRCAKRITGSNSS
jgi:hypothetical protein